MAWAMITIYTSKCAQMDPQQLPKTSKFYSRCKKCDIEKTLGGGYHHPPFGSPKVNVGPLRTVARGILDTGIRSRRRPMSRRLTNALLCLTIQNNNKSN